MSGSWDNRVTDAHMDRGKFIGPFPTLLGVQLSTEKKFHGGYVTIAQFTDQSLKFHENKKWYVKSFTKFKNH